MKVNIYSIYDYTAKAYAQPFYCADSPDHILAVRAFDSMIVPGSFLNDHPNDFALFYMGVFDDHSGNFHKEENVAFKIYSAADIIGVRNESETTQDMINKLKEIK